MWKDEMGGCTRVGNGLFLAECDIDAFGVLGAKSSLSKVKRDAVEAVASSDWDLCLAEVQLLVTMVALSSSWTGYGELLLTVGVSR